MYGKLNCETTAASMSTNSPSILHILNAASLQPLALDTLHSSLFLIYSLN